MNRQSSNRQSTINPAIANPKSGNALIAVIIVNFNSGQHLRRCLASLSPGLSEIEWQALVVDNASTDRSEKVALDAAPDVALLRADANFGFAKAANLGVRRTTAPLLLFLNPDAQLTPGFIGPLLEELDQHANCDIVAPNIVNDDGTPQGNARGDPTLFTGVFGRAGLARRFFPSSRLVGQNVITPDVLAPGTVSREVDWVSGACLLMRREAFERVNGFDEGYFLYWEDADLCRRIRATGGTVRYRPGVSVSHVVGQSSRTAKSLATRAFHDSAYRYYRTHIASSPLNPLRWAAWTLLRARLVFLRAVDFC